MKVGVLTVPFSGQPLPEALSYLRSLGVEALEIGCGGYPGKGHCNPRELLENKAKLKQFKETIEEFGMPISALGCHGNMVNPDKEAAARYQADFDDALLLAEELGINKVITFSGCPATAPRRNTPTGSPAPGRTNTRKFWITSGTRCLSPSGPSSSKPAAATA